MPGTGVNYRNRSSRRWTFSTDRMTLSADGGIPLVPFGLIFSMIGIACFLLIPYVIFVPTPNSFWKILVAIPLLALISIGLLAGGYGFCLLQRATIDRRRKTVTTRNGWLGIQRCSYSLDQYSSISIGSAKCPIFYYSPFDTIYKVSFVLKSGQEIVVGYATDEHFASDIQRELLSFLGSKPSSSASDLSEVLA